MSAGHMNPAGGLERQQVQQALQNIRADNGSLVTLIATVTGLNIHMVLEILREIAPDRVAEVETIQAHEYRGPGPIQHFGTYAPMETLENWPTVELHRHHEGRTLELRLSFSDLMINSARSPRDAIDDIVAEVVRQLERHFAISRDSVRYLRIEGARVIPPRQLESASDHAPKPEPRPEGRQLCLPEDPS